jgi:hypothetical protein
LEFAASFLFNVSALESASMVEDDFDEGGGNMILRRGGDTADVSWEGTNWSCQCTYDQLRSAARNFLVDVLRDLSSLNPPLMGNAYIQKIVGEYLPADWDLRSSDPS